MILCTASGAVRPVCVVATLVVADGHVESTPAFPCFRAAKTVAITPRGLRATCDQEAIVIELDREQRYEHPIYRGLLADASHADEACEAWELGRLASAGVLHLSPGYADAARWDPLQPEARPPSGGAMAATRTPGVTPFGAMPGSN